MGKESIIFKCPECNVPLEAPPQYAGKKSKCPNCKKIILIPKEEGGENGRRR